jgi:hypothetical protein
MNPAFLLLLPLGALPPLPPSDLESIGRRVWQNEAAGKIEGLADWNTGEAFASLGIGHFIWYPQGPKGPFEESFPGLVRFLSERREPVKRAFESLAATPQGRFALIDYVNFKGEGTKSTERYAGQGWGLLQVLEGMPPGGRVSDFAKSAEEMLRRRVKNAPADRHEERWLPGWLNRVQAYAPRG